MFVREAYGHEIMRGGRPFRTWRMLKAQLKGVGLLMNKCFNYRRQGRWCCNFINVLYKGISNDVVTECEPYSLKRHT